MGLSQAYGFARQSGGTLTIDSQVGRGTTIHFFLPRARQGVVPTALPHRTTARPEAGGGRVLLVEDDVLVRSVVGPALRAAGFEVREAATAEEAWQQLQEQQNQQIAATSIDILFSDIVMPGAMSGLDLAEAVRQRYPQIRIVLATGYSERQLALPGVEVLAKPYDVSEAVALLRRT